jgi:hypothetical protein
MAKDPVCSRFVEEKPDSLRVTQMEKNTSFVLRHVLMNSLLHKKS